MPNLAAEAASKLPAVRVVIPAAGLGTRFAALSLGMPKELLPLGGRPLIGHALAEAARAGFEAAIVVVSPAKHQVRQFLADNELPLSVEVVIQPEPLGIGDAVLRCWQGEPIAVLLPDDVVFNTEHWTTLTKLHRVDGAATLCVRPVPFETASRFGIAECDGDRVIGLVEKPPVGTSPSNLAIFGRYVVTEPVVAGLRSSRVAGELQLTYGFAVAIKEEPGVRAVRFGGDIYDCGTPADYAESAARFPG
jgi:UTP--glucose-1-phosphate uridylyltransferase